MAKLSDEQVTEALADLGAPAAPHPGADHFLEGRRDRRADLERCAVGHRLDVAHHEVLVDGDAQPHVVERFVGLDHAAELVVEVVGLDVGQAPVDVPQAVGAPVAAEFHGAGVQMVAFDGGRERHGGLTIR